MRLATCLTLTLLCAAVSSLPATVQAVPITGGTGPGGYGTIDGSSNLRIWLVGDTVAAGSVSSWTDSSGSGNTATQGIALRRPTAVAASLNGHTVLTFAEGDGTRDGMEIVDDTDLNPAASLTMMAVQFIADTAVRYNASISKHSTGAWTDGWGLDPLSTGVASNELRLWSTGGQVGPIVSYGKVGHHILTGAISATAVHTRVDGTGPAPTGGIAMSATVGTPVRVGFDNPHASYNLLGSMAEAIFTNVAMNSAERTIVENYLSSKYDVALNTGGGALDLYAGDTGGNGDYDFDVFGIGRVDASNQVTNTGAAGFGIEATGGTLGNSEWVLAGHNGLSGETGGVWNRIWYVDKDDASNVDVTLAFDFSDYGLVPPSLSPGSAVIRLLYHPTDDTMLADLGLVAGVSGDTVTFNLLNVDLQNGYYTLSVTAIPEPSTFGLLALGAVGLAWRVRRKRAMRNER